MYALVLSWVLCLQGKKVKARLLVIADGATSRLATKLGYCTEAPRGVCSRAFVKGGTHNTDFDGMVFSANLVSYQSLLMELGPTAWNVDDIVSIVDNACLT